MSNRPLQNPNTNPQWITRKAIIIRVAWGETPPTRSLSTATRTSQHPIGIIATNREAAVPPIASAPTIDMSTPDRARSGQGNIRGCQAINCARPLP